MLICIKSEVSKASAIVIMDINKKQKATGLMAQLTEINCSTDDFIYIFMTIGIFSSVWYLRM